MNSSVETVLREQIDDLSLRLLMGELSGVHCGECPEHWRTAIAEVDRLARATNHDAAIQIAAELIQSVQGPPNRRLAEDSLMDGLTKLLHAVENAGSASASGSETKSSSSTRSSLMNDPELLADSLLELREHLANIEVQILQLERDGAEGDAVHAVFRGFHTIKGIAGFLAVSEIQTVAHEVETILNMVRENRLAINSGIIDVILASVDYLREAFARLEAVQSGNELVLDNPQSLIVRVRALASGQPVAEPPAPVSRASGPPPAEVTASPAPEPPAAPQAQLKTPVRPAAEDADSESEPEASRASTKPNPQQPQKAAATEAQKEGFRVRVDTAKLDYLMDMVGEMVVAQSVLQHNASSMKGGADPRLMRDLNQLSRITGEVQRVAMGMRLTPVRQLFQRLGRQLRDLSRKIGKPVELVTQGEETGLDKTVLDEIADPLMHMVRNAVDHGIETPEERSQTDKPATATIGLNAYHRGGDVVIEVSDDGRGMNPAKILAKAQARGLVAEGATLTEAEIFRLVLEPGFSTAEKVTEVSGRGIGMDVVKRQAEKLRGRLEISSRLGKGTTFQLRLPLTLAIIDGLIISTGEERFILPLSSVKEMFRATPEAISTVGGSQEVVLVRNQLLPVLRLYRRFGLTPRTEDPCEALMIVVENDGRLFCLMVDELHGKQEVVIKSLGDGLDKIKGLAGCAILGDGRLGLIVDPAGLWEN